MGCNYAINMRSYQHYSLMVLYIPLPGIVLMFCHSWLICVAYLHLRNAWRMLWQNHSGCVRVCISVTVSTYVSYLQKANIIAENTMPYFDRTWFQFVLQRQAGMDLWN